MSSFADHFSRVADAYAARRPGYPPELFMWLASLAPRRELAWDCGWPIAMRVGRVAG